MVCPVNSGALSFNERLIVLGLSLPYRPVPWGDTVKSGG